MTRYTILLKHNWKAPDWSSRKLKKQDVKPLGGQDIGDLELGTRTKLIPRLERQGEMDSFRFHTIRFYRALSSLFIFSMVFILLYSCTAHSTHSRLGYGGKEKLIQQRAPVSRQMTIDNNQDKDLSSLPYDEFIYLMEEQMNKRKNGDQVKVTQTKSDDRLNSSVLSLRNASSTAVSKPQDHLEAKSEGKNMTLIQDSKELTMETPTNPSPSSITEESQRFLGLGMHSNHPQLEDVSKEELTEKIQDPSFSSFTPLVESQMQPKDFLLPAFQSQLLQHPASTLENQDYTSFGFGTNQFLASRSKLTIPDYLRSNLQYPLLPPLSSTFPLLTLNGSPGIETNPNAILNSGQFYSQSKM